MRVRFDERARWPFHLATARFAVKFITFLEGPA
jgi:hypothetical protein